MKRSAVCLLVLFVVALFVPNSTYSEKIQTESVYITAAHVNLDADGKGTIFIYGSNLGDNPEVMLDETQLTVLNSTNASIEAEVEDILPGTYRLAVASLGFDSSDPSTISTLDVTIVDAYVVSVATDGSTEGDATIAAVAPEGSIQPAAPGGGGGNKSPKGDITAVIAGAGLAGGATEGDATLSLDTGYTDGRYVQTGNESDPTVPASVKDGVDWTEVTGIPAGFADGVDDDSGGGDITSVTAGTGLIGGGESGDVTISLGTVGIANGGTGITTAPSAPGQYLHSTGPGVWSVGNIQASDVPPIALAGDVTGQTTNTLVTGLRGRSVSSLLPTSGDVLSFDAAAQEWVPAAPAIPTIADGSVTNAMLTNDSIDVVAGTGLTGGGTVSLGGSVTLGLAASPSDARFKTNVSQLSHVLEDVEKIRGVSFEWNEVYASLTGDSTGGREIGVIAQEIEAVYPELVTTSGDENYKSVNYTKLTAVLIEAVKELKAEKDAQQIQIVKQQEEIADLRARLARLEALVAGRSSFAALPE